MEDVRWAEIPEMAFCSPERILSIFHRDLIRGKKTYALTPTKSMSLDTLTLGQLSIRRVAQVLGLPMPEIIRNLFDTTISAQEVACSETILDLCEKIAEKDVPYYIMNNSGATCLFSTCSSLSIFTAIRGILRVKGYNVSRIQPSSRLCEMPTPMINLVMRDLVRSFPNECPQITLQHSISSSRVLLTIICCISALLCIAEFFKTGIWFFMVACLCAIILSGVFGAGVREGSRIQVDGVSTVKELCKRIASDISRASL